MQTWTRRDAGMQTCRHRHAGIQAWTCKHANMDMQTDLQTWTCKLAAKQRWTCRNADMDMQTWICKHGLELGGGNHGMLTWTCRHGHGHAGMQASIFFSPQAHRIHVHMPMSTSAFVSMSKPSIWMTYNHGSFTPQSSSQTETNRSDDP